MEWYTITYITIVPMQIDGLMFNPVENPKTAALIKWIDELWEIKKA